MYPFPNFTKNISLLQLNMKYVNIFFFFFVIPVLLGDINNSYPRIFSPAVSSPTLIEKFKILLIWMLYFFISLNRTWERRRDTQRYYILLFLSAHAKISCTCGPPAITNTSKHVRRQLPFLSKSYLYLFRKSGTKFPADWRNIHFYQAENQKFVGTKKSTGLISLWHELKTRFMVARAFHPVIWHLKRNKRLFFPFFSFFTSLG